MYRYVLAALAAALSPTSASAASFVATNTGDITAYFAGSSAGFTEKVGLRINGVDTGVVGLNNQTSKYGDKLVLGSATAGDVLTFFIAVTPWKGFGNDYTIFSDPALNSDKREHVRVSSFAGDGKLPLGTMIGFEDLIDGDFDFNDTKFVVTNVSKAMPAVPEPATWAMMLTGFGVVGAMLRTRRSLRRTSPL